MSVNYTIAFVVMMSTIFSSMPCFANDVAAEAMTLEEKVGQLLMVHVNGEEAGDDAKQLIQQQHIGGIIYYTWANGLTSPEQVALLSQQLQGLSLETKNAIPLFIAVDQEGGRVCRLTQGFTLFPANRVVAASQNPQLAQDAAFTIGQELKAVGINFNLAPVVDVDSNPLNPIIGSRSFGSSPDIVIAFGSKALQGYHQAGIISSLKHFPGHGDTSTDSHEDLPVVKKSLQELQRCELMPFAALKDQADTIMTAHILLPAIDPTHCATLSKAVLDLLRQDMGFDGVIISDSLVMEGLLKNSAATPIAAGFEMSDSPEALIACAAIGALHAGCDILLLGGKQLIGAHSNLELTVEGVKRIHTALVEAVKRGKISEINIDKAVERILKLKRKYSL